MKITAKDTIKRFELIFKAVQSLDVLVQINPNSWLPCVPDDVSKVRSVGIKYHKVIPADKHGHVRQIVHRVEAKAKSSNFFSVMNFSCFI